MLIIGLAILLFALLLFAASGRAVKSDREFISRLTATDPHRPHRPHLSSLVHRDDE